MTTSESLWAALAAQVDAQIQGRSDYAQIARQMGTEDGWTVASVFDRDDATGELDPLSCTWRVKVAVPDGWLAVADVHWSRLPLTLEQVRQEAAWAAVQADSAS